MRLGIRDFGLRRVNRMSILRWWRDWWIMFVFWHGIFLRNRCVTVNDSSVRLIPLVSVTWPKYKIMNLFNRFA